MRAVPVGRLDKQRQMGGGRDGCAVLPVCGRERKKKGPGSTAWSKSAGKAV